MVHPNHTPSSEEAVENPSEHLKPPAAKKRKVVIIRRKSSASRERQTSTSDDGDTSAQALTGDSHTSESSTAVRRIMIRRVKTSTAPSTHPSSVSVRTTPDWTCIDQSKPLEDVEGVRSVPSQASIGEPTVQSLASSNTSGMEMDEAPLTVDSAPEGTQLPGEQEGVRRKSVAEVKAEM